MKLTVYSQNRIRETFSKWGVPKDFADPMFNYLVYGYSPGSCFTAVLANDFIGAVRSSHPNNTIEAFKALAGWISDTLPEEVYGSYDKVDKWCNMTSALRRPILEKHHIVLTEKQEVWMALKSEPTQEPMLF
jgi:hypothetical protein